jgi:hypothetical protein
MSQLLLHKGKAIQGSTAVADFGREAVSTPESFIDMVWGLHAREPSRWFEVQRRRQNRKPPDTYEEASRRDLLPCRVDTSGRLIS